MSFSPFWKVGFSTVATPSTRRSLMKSMSLSWRGIILPLKLTIVFMPRVYLTRRNSSTGWNLTKMYPGNMGSMISVNFPSRQRLNLSFGARTSIPPWARFTAARSSFLALVFTTYQCLSSIPLLWCKSADFSSQSTARRPGAIDRSVSGRLTLTTCYAIIRTGHRWLKKTCHN